MYVVNYYMYMYTELSKDNNYTRMLYADIRVTWTILALSLILCTLNTTCTCNLHVLITVYNWTYFVVHLPNKPS